MTDMTTEPETTDTAAEADGPKQLREALKHEKAKSAKLTAQLMERAYREAGLDTSQGLGKAIAKEYKGEPTGEALLAYANEEYGYEPPDTSDSPIAGQVTAGNKRLDDVQSGSVSTTPLTDDDALVKASRDKDLKTLGNIKAAKLRAMMKG